MEKIFTDKICLSAFQRGVSFKNKEKFLVNSFRYENKSIYSPVKTFNLNIKYS
ncbi:hypothetical protein EV198_3549 [Roseivirga ehrenbergii]|nr:hypothetical protein EV198_3549 [Roseivirga ehrenbergii]